MRPRRGRVETPVPTAAGPRPDHGKIYGTTAVSFLRAMKFDDLVEHLANCGLEDKEARLYLDLVVHGPAKASKAAKRTGLSRMDAYNHLKALESAGLVEATMERPMRFLPLDLDEGLELLKKRKEQEIARIEQEAAVLREHVRPAEADPGTFDVTFKVHQDRKQILLQMHEMLDDAEESVRVMATRRGLVHLLSRLQDDLFQAALDRGVEVRILTFLDASNLEHAGPLVDWTELRHSAYANQNYVLKDGDEVLVTMAMEDRPAGKGREDTALWTNSSDFIASQEAIFRRLWLDSVAFEDRVVEIRTGRIVGPLRLSVGPGGSMYDRFLEVLRDDPGRVWRGGAGAVEAFGIPWDALVRSIGRRIGAELANEVLAGRDEAEARPGAPPDDVEDVDAFWTDLPARWTELGLGQLTLEVVGPDEVEATVLGSVASKELAGASDSEDADAPATRCHLDAGILEGAGQRLVGTRCRAEERTCAAAGGEACVFEVRFERDEPLLPVLRKRG